MNMEEYLYTDPHSDSEEDEEETLSLRDLPLEDHNEIAEKAGSHSRRSSSEPSEFFEFFSNLSSEMCSADDIMFCGKLIPSKEISSPIHSNQQDKRRMFFSRRSESLSGLHSSVSRSNSISNSKLMMRNSRSLDYRKLERFSTSKSTVESENPMERNSSTRSTGRGDHSAKRTGPKPRWYVLMFGVIKPPTEMVLRDIKSRNVRRNPMNASFPPPVANNVKKPTVSKGSSKLLKVLSCRDHASVTVTTSLTYVPPA